MNELFHRFARSTANLIGTPIAFALAVIVVVLWALLGPLFHYSDSWQLVINTATKIGRAHV